SIHVTWALATGARLGVGNDPRYNKTRCFDPFPFPNVRTTDRSGSRTDLAPASLGGTIALNLCNLAEKLDAHRKRQQADHPELTLTGMYNVLEKLRSGESLTPSERTIHEQGVVSVLRQIHDELDETVLHAYGWGDLIPWLRIAHGNDASDTGPTRDEAKRAFEETILERLVALNAERAADEAKGKVLWLRPEFQNPE